MNKLIAGIYLLILSIGTIASLYIPSQAAEPEETIVIPKEAIRLRILANSDHAADQALKRKIRDDVNAEITNWVSDLESLPEARRLLKSKLPEIQQIALERAAKEGATSDIRVKFDKAKFPTKLYGQFLYPAGEYEAIVITIGEGKGANWWCVLYPPLCFLDFSNGTAIGPGVEENSQPDETKESVYAEENSQPDEMKEPVYEEENSQPGETKEPVYAEENSQLDEIKEPVYAEGKPQVPEVKFAILELFKRGD
ncbi:stage II sporulation protein R [Bacillus aerolatus]|uniref:Stage II sporulation protein R n=1 Tax=Bacillus aerolatus TaxID=2653354 RepID=A0A6I1FKX8_9BACI|nr:stage II sporulation protein R [Bacillus aerolatus]KAB7707478.1 stage II sporulation protein R [Bacillus aerolatus]